MSTIKHKQRFDSWLYCSLLIFDWMRLSRISYYDDASGRDRTSSCSCSHSFIYFLRFYCCSSSCHERQERINECSTIQKKSYRTRYTFYKKVLKLYGMLKMCEISLIWLNSTHHKIQRANTVFPSIQYEKWSNWFRCTY